MTYQAIHHPMEKMFTVVLDQGHEAKVTYSQQGMVLHLDYSEVPEALRGKGYGGAMMEAVLHAIEQEGFKVVPECSYIKHYMDTHKDWAHLRAS